MKKLLLFIIIIINSIFLNGQDLYYIQIGAFKEMQNIDNFIENYKDHNLIIDFNENYYKIKIGYFENFEDASFYMLNKNINGFIDYKSDYFIKPEKTEKELLENILNQLINMNDKLNNLSNNINNNDINNNDINNKIEINNDSINNDSINNSINNSINDFINDSIKPIKNNKFNNTISFGVSLLELHNDEFINYNGLILGFKNNYSLSEKIHLNLSINYGYYQPNALNNSYNITGYSNILKITPSISYNSRFFYGLGISYFNYKYSYEAFLKPGENGITNINKELLKRNNDIGINLNIGLNLFKNISINFTNYFDNNNRRIHSLKLEYKIRTN